MTTTCTQEAVPGRGPIEVPGSRPGGLAELLARRVGTGAARGRG